MQRPRPTWRQLALSLGSCLLLAATALIAPRAARAGTSVDLSVSSSHTGNFVVGAGRTGTYTLLVRNAGPAATTAPIVVTDVAPIGTEPLDASGTGFACDPPNGHSVVCTYEAALPAGATTPPLSVVVRAVGPAFEVVNRSIVEPGGADVDSNIADNITSDPTKLVPEPTIDYVFLQTTGSIEYRIGGNITSGNITITNGPFGPNSIQGTGYIGGTRLTFSVVPFLGGTIVVDDPQIRCFLLPNINTLLLAPAYAAYENQPRTAFGTTALGLCINPLTFELMHRLDLAVADRRGGDNDLGMLYGGDARRPDLAVRTIEAPRVRPAVGLDGTYRVHVRNNNTNNGATTGSIDTVLRLPDGMRFSRSRSDCLPAFRFVVCQVAHSAANRPHAALAPNKSISIELDLVPTAEGPQTVTATVATPRDANPANNSGAVTVDVRPPGPNLRFERAEGSVGEGQVTYRLQLFNGGGVRVSRDDPASITATLPEGLTLSRWSGPLWDCSASTGQELSCTFNGNIERRSTSFAFDVAVDALPGEYEVAFHADVPGEIDPDDNDATISSTVP